MDGPTIVTVMNGDHTQSRRDLQNPFDTKNAHPPLEFFPNPGAVPEAKEVPLNASPRPLPYGASKSLLQPSNGTKDGHKMVVDQGNTRPEEEVGQHGGDGSVGLPQSAVDNTQPNGEINQSSHSGTFLSTSSSKPETGRGLDSPQANGFKLSAEKMQELAASPDSLPVRPLDPSALHNIRSEELDPDGTQPSSAKSFELSGDDIFDFTPKIDATPLGPAERSESRRPRNLTIEVGDRHQQPASSPSLRPWAPQRALSTPNSVKSPMSPHKSDRGGTRPTLKIPDPSSRMEGVDGRRYSSSGRPLPSPMPSSIPLPPLSIPTYLQLELSSQRPSQLYIHRSAHSDFPYESSRVKIERLMNFLLLPPHLEGVLWFGTLACLDSWLYTFTILPLRLLKSFYILAKSWSANFTTEVHFMSNFIYNGTGRMWKRRRSSLSQSQPSARKSATPGNADSRSAQSAPPQSRKKGKTHQRTKSVPSALLPDDKADMLKGLLIICTCLILLRLDASRMYHWIRGQAAIKLYVIYNLLEVCDRLFSAIGQDVLECLFSREALERKPDGHSKILRPFWLFVLALTYTVIHSTALFYQVITLNVAVNAYSNALITLLLSNQFVEIKSTVFKKFEKENLFQLTCADIVERFHLWHMLLIIASRNIVETGTLSAGLSALAKAASTTSSAALSGNSSIPFTGALPPRSVSSILPRSFTLLPAMMDSITSYAPVVSQIFGPFIAVLGSEMLVDWLKHAYINKFNNTRPAIYDRFLDVLAKDYYTNAFGDQNLTKRLGLPVIPLSCLLIRASVQTYQMFMASWVPSASSSSSTSLASIHEHYSSARANMPMTTGTAISRTIDDIIKAIPAVITSSSVVTHMTTVLMVLLIFLILLAFKLVLGMLLLAFARSRYRSMKLRERNPIHHVEGGRRVGGWGVVEVDDDKRRWVYEDDPAGLRGLREREEREKKDREKGHGVETFEKVKRYEMVAKRIW